MIAGAPLFALRALTETESEKPLRRENIVQAERVAYTISRGEIIVDKGELVGSRGRGLRVKRGPHQPL